MSRPAQPSFQFYPGDWLKDPHLRMCSVTTRGVWIDALAAMHENGRSGSITGSVDQLARLCGCSSEEMETALEDLADTGTANVTFLSRVTKANGKVTQVVTLTNRRMEREHKARKGGAKRQAQYRDRQASNEPSNAKVTASSSSSSSSSSSKERERAPTRAKAEREKDFEEWWSAYPRKIGKTAARKKWASLARSGELPSLDALLGTLRNHCRAPQWTKDGGEYIPHPTTYLNQGRYLDEFGGNGKPSMPTSLDEVDASLAELKRLRERAPWKNPMRSS